MILYLNQKIRSGISLLTKGPIALFFGGKDIIPLLSTDSDKSSNFSQVFIFLVVLSAILQLLMATYKRRKFRKEILYEQKLQQAAMSGVRNVYGQIVIFTGFLGFWGCFGIHIFLIERNKEIKHNDDLGEDSSIGILILSSILSLMIITIFIRNSKLR